MLKHCVFCQIESEGVCVDSVDGDMATPLHYAAARGHAACAVWLLRKGARPDAKDANGHTPIDDATENGHNEVSPDAIARCTSPNNY